MSRFERVTLPLSSTFGFFDSPDEASADNVTALDLDGDGELELVVHFWEELDRATRSQPVETDAFVPNRLAILDASSKGWEEVTSEVLQATPFRPNSLGGASRQNRVADLNGDGSPDIAWSVNQEDGRSGDSDFGARTSILLSSADGTYDVVAPGTEFFVHAIGARSYDESHAQKEGIVVASGYGSRPQAFIIVREGLVATETLPVLGNSSLKHLNYGAPDDDNVYFFTDTSDLHPAVLQRTPDGTWSIIDKVPITEGIDTRTFREVPVWNGDVNPEVTAYRFQGEWVRVPSVNDAAEIDLTGENAHHIVAHLSGNTLTETENSVVEAHRNYLMFFEFADGTLNRLDIPIDGYDGNTNRNFIDVIDVDGDGLDDVVSYDYIYAEDDPLFNVYRNTGENRFEKLDLDAALPEPLATTGSSLIRDFNGDGRLDILEWASDGGVDDPDSPSAVIHYAMQDWISPGGRPSVGDERDNAEYFRTVQEAYIAYYDRPADAGGLAYWSDRLDQNNGDLDSIIDAFANSPEALDRYGSIVSETIVEVIRLVYQGIFDRAPDRNGLEFYTEGYARGDFSPGSMALDIAAGAVGKDELLLENRISMGILEAFG